jgi:hypothetical protein
MDFATLNFGKVVKIPEISHFRNVKPLFFRVRETFFTHGIHFLHKAFVEKTRNPA